MSELGDSYDYADSYLDQDDLSDEESESIDSKADKRAHHNALERKRRDHIKDSFCSLRDAVPPLRGEKVNSHKASRAQILKKAAEYIDHMRRRNNGHQKDIDLLRKENKLLEEKIREMEAMKASGGQINKPANKQFTTPPPTVVSANNIDSTSAGQLESKPKPIPKQIQPTIRIRTGSSSEGSKGGTSLLECNNHHRIKRESISSDSEYSEPKNLVQIVKTEKTNHQTLLPTTVAAGSIILNRTGGTTLLQQPVITLASKQVYKQQNNKNSLLGPPAKRKRIAESGVTIIASNIGSLVGK